MNNLPYTPRASNRDRGAFEIAFLYLTISSLWILFSDKLVAQIAPNQTALTAISIYKGWGFVVVTALILYWLIRHDHTARQLVEEALQNAHDDLERQIQLRTAALSQANTLLETMLEYMPDQIYFKDTESRFIRNSRAQATALGLSDPSQVVGKTDFDFFPHAQRSYDEEQEIIRSGKPLVDFEERVAWPDGKETWVSTTKVPLRDPNGQIIGTFGISRDITERKQAEESLRKAKEELELKVAERTNELKDANAQLQLELTERKHAEEKLHESEERFRRFFENMHETFIVQEVVVDETGKPIDLRYLDINPAAERFIGKTRSEIVGKTREQLVGRPDPEGVEMAGRVTSTGAPAHLIRYSPGFGGWFESFTYSLGSGIVATLSMEITERIQAEEELRRSNAELEQFAYVASHDLQEPLRAVAGMVQLLQQRYQGKLDARADEYIGHAVDASTRMQNLINDLLEYSRVNRLGKPLEKIDLENCMKNALANLQVSIQESSAQITHDPLPTIMADATQLTQVLQNLIGNAIKFRGERALHIHIGARQLEYAWQFEVRDNGIGIESRHFERIFQVFQRLHTRREYPGTGIGLSLCKKIIERHGGQIWLESQPGEGSVFYFTLPER